MKAFIIEDPFKESRKSLEMLGLESMSSLTILLFPWNDSTLGTKARLNYKRKISMVLSTLNQQYPSSGLWVQFSKIANLQEQIVPYSHSGEQLIASHPVHSHCTFPKTRGAPLDLCVISSSLSDAYPPFWEFIHRNIHLKVYFVLSILKKSIFSLGCIFFPLTSPYYSMILIQNLWSYWNFYRQG